ncbi:PadR family transcriptional regulator [Amnibacterium setariae]|uniref:PadR family transcriptional regulator n=1 Tax=Amnibacterium setariae TaxID=2306585 RepID=A0A3A1TVB2_9MICO|nr:helix-turn-helix transcriptional regulator [Amnibacterium setariae]RIX27568.1 PadR family transcriptional regulator [Amnibacterium setariae]
MNGSSSSRPTGSRSAVGFGLDRIREAVEDLRSPGDRRARPRPERSDVRDAVLTVLEEQPADGYRIVRVLQERSGDGPGTSAGEVYPALQLLADEGLVTAAETDGRKTWTVTAAGRAAAGAARTRTADEVRDGDSDHADRADRRGVARSGAALASAAALAARTGTPAQVAEVVAVLDDARRRVFAILSRG